MTGTAEMRGGTWMAIDHVCNKDKAFEFEWDYCPTCGKKFSYLPTDLPLDRETPESIQKLRQMVEDYANYVLRDYHEDGEWKHYIYEATMEAFYGNDFWDWFARVTS